MKDNIIDLEEYKIKKCIYKPEEITVDSAEDIFDLLTSGKRITIIVEDGED